MHFRRFSHFSINYGGNKKLQIEYIFPSVDDVSAAYTHVKCLIFTKSNKVAESENVISLSANKHFRYDVIN